jgi:hypothetical protein
MQKVMIEFLIKDGHNEQQIQYMIARATAHLHYDEEIIIDFHIRKIELVVTGQMEATK